MACYEAFDAGISVGVGLEHRLESEGSDRGGAMRKRVGRRTGDIAPPMWQDYRNMERFMSKQVGPLAW